MKPIDRRGREEIQGIRRGAEPFALRWVTLTNEQF